MIPRKLYPGDEIRIVAPSCSLGIISKENRNLAKKKLEQLGLKVSFSKNVDEMNDFKSSSITSRVEDLHEAFLDENVKMVLAAIGGFNVNQILNYLDYDLIKKNPKILCGYSDITALSLAIYEKTGIVTYSGPAFVNFAMKRGSNYTEEYFMKCLFRESSFAIKPSEQWSDDVWYLDQIKREFNKNIGELIVNEGEAQGKIIGGNLCTLNLLLGTEFMPSIRGAILFIEDDEESTLNHFDRNLQSLLHQLEFSEVVGIVIGRFQKASGITIENMIRMIKTKKELTHIPVVVNFDFGHTSPLFTFPIGGIAKLSARKGKVRLAIIKH